MTNNFKQGIFKPINPHKYKGNPTNIIYRSSWEKRFFNWVDQNSAVISWSSEEFFIPYICGTDNKCHRYFVDIRMSIRDQTGNLNEYLVEIKPLAQTKQPKFPGKNTKRYLHEVENYIKNQSKWKAAKEYAEQRGMKFLLITEKELGIK